MASGPKDSFGATGKKVKGHSVIRHGMALVNGKRLVGIVRRLVNGEQRVASRKRLKLVRLRFELRLKIEKFKVEGNKK
jgi:hypothetical protein